jgi:hypothetical protein
MTIRARYFWPRTIPITRPHPALRVGVDYDTRVVELTPTLFEATDKLARRERIGERAGQ